MLMPSSSLPDEIIDFKPEVGIVLGSGLGFFADDRIEVLGRVPYSEIDGFPVSTVPGHSGQFVYGDIGGKRVVCMQGRFHFYEGYAMDEVTLPVRLLAKAGISHLYLTNAAGGIDPALAVGDLMLIEDHINFMGRNPLIGVGEENGVLFPDMSEVYDLAIRERLIAWCEDQEILLKRGVYVAVSGPSYETPAEIRMFGVLGASAVGMSTVPEAIVARKFGVKVVGISCITNAAAGLSDQLLSHEEVAETAAKVRQQFADVLAGAISLSEG